MSYLIDTNCISELVKQTPEPNVVRWFRQQKESELYLSVITFGELNKGIEKLDSSDRKSRLHRWVNEDLYFRFEERILNITLAEVNEWGRILAEAEAKGKLLPAVDTLIAATASVHQLAVVTRNVDDMKTAGVELINPWEYTGE